MQQRLATLEIYVTDAAPSQNGEGASKSLAINEAAMPYQSLIMRKRTEIARRVAKIGNGNIADARNQPGPLTVLTSRARSMAGNTISRTLADPRSSDHGLVHSTKAVNRDAAPLSCKRHPSPPLKSEACRFPSRLFVFLIQQN